MDGGYDSESTAMDCDEKKWRPQEGVTFIDGFNDMLWEVCPLDKSHYCRKMDMKSHTKECKRVCLKSLRKVECPFNPLHIINLMEIADHVMTCENRIVQTNNLCDFEPKRETVEGVAMDPLNVAIHVPNTWEDGRDPEGGYDGTEATKFRAVMRPVPPGLSKRQKREWREKERLRFKSLVGETREKPRSAPYPTPSQIKNAKAAGKRVAEARDDEDIMGIIDKLGSANIADPRDATMRRINERLKVLQAMEKKLKEEKLELQRQVEIYLASIGKTDEEADATTETADAPSRNFDPRMAPRRRGRDEAAKETSTPDRVPRIVPDPMTLAMVR